MINGFFKQYYKVKINNREYNVTKISSYFNRDLIAKIKRI